ncbi:Auxin-responsive family protein [Melia azedarach]|uniref:Auxin-responsive family protein n=1 Tax=Melia azedarach TaxID=155640 RepID=A0ACC1XNB7_MELAZ|nr:Auxin-responsive family protein [Melia azedarach]
MKRYRGFKLGRKIVKVFKWIIRPRRKPAKYHIRLGDSAAGNCNAMSKLLSLGRQLRRGASKLGFSRSNPPIIQQLGRTKPSEVPKGHLAVYVGESDDETKRVLVPVIYFNHPLFGELLKEAEQAYGFNHPGGITIPCRISEFEKVKMRIAAWDHCRRRHHRLHW